MGCIYSNQNKSSKTNSDNSVSGIASRYICRTRKRSNRQNSDQPVNGSRTNGRRIFEACSMKQKVDGNKSEHQKGQIEITDNELIFHFEGKRLDWPLKYLRGYAGVNELFSFECGRKCSTGPGIFVFDCPQAGQLLETLKAQIGVMASSNNNNTHMDLNHNQHSQPIVNNNGNTLSHHEYQNTVNSNISEPLQHGDNHLSILPTSTSSQQIHTYLNSTVIGYQMKSQPNYYTSNPLSSSGSRYNGSKHSLDETSNGSVCGSTGRRATNCGFDSKTLPSMKSESNFSRSYVNSSNIIASQNGAFGDSSSTNCRIRRCSESSNIDHHHPHHQHQSYLIAQQQQQQNKINAKKLEQIQSKMSESENLGTFCYVTFDQNVIKNRNKSPVTGFIKNRSTSSSCTNNLNFSNQNVRAQPESYVQLDLMNKQNNGQHGSDKASSNYDSIAHINTNNHNYENNETNYNHNNGNFGAAKSRSKSLTSSTMSRNSNTTMNNNNHHNPIENGGFSSLTTFSSLTKNGRIENDNNDKEINNTINFNNNSVVQTNSANNNLTSTMSATTVPYAQIDFAKTIALSTSTANHRKL